MQTFLAKSTSSSVRERLQLQARTTARRDPRPHPRQLALTPAKLSLQRSVSHRPAYDVPNVSRAEHIATFSRHKYKFELTDLLVEDIVQIGITTCGYLWHNLDWDTEIYIRKQ